jgi:hypothetical protein
MALHPSVRIETGDREYVRILAIDGGGMRGIVPAVFLEELESKVKRPLSEVFDLFRSRTSRGGRSTRRPPSATSIASTGGSSSTGRWPMSSPRSAGSLGPSIQHTV